jgi:hypothetical protein
MLFLYPVMVAPCVRIVVASIENQPGAVTEKKDGKIQFEIQKQSGSAIATAGERNG